MSPALKPGAPDFAFDEKGDLIIDGVTVDIRGEVKLHPDADGHKSFTEEMFEAAEDFFEAMGIDEKLALEEWEEAEIDRCEHDLIIVEGTGEEVVKRCENIGVRLQIINILGEKALKYCCLEHGWAPGKTTLWKRPKRD